MPDEKLLSIADIHDGLLLTEADEELHDLVRQVAANGGEGTMNIQIKVKQASDGGTLFGLAYRIGSKGPSIERKNLYPLGETGLLAGALLPVPKKDDRQLTLADARQAINRLDTPNDHTPPEAYNIVNMPKKDTANG